MLNGKMKNHIVTIAGGSGMLGKALKKRFNSEGWRVHILSTSQNNPEAGVFPWAPYDEPLSPDLINGTELVINLAGAGIADQRWTRKRKKELYNSRIYSTRRIVEAVNQLPENKRPAMISASAIGYYSYRSKENMTESSEAGEGFVSELCRDWEKEAKLASINNLSILRIGIVLSKEGGFLGRLKQFAKFKLLAPLGSGKEKISWIHIEDVVEICYQLALKKLPSGTYNVVSPKPESNATIIKKFNQLMGNPNFLPPVPSFIIKLLYGKMGVETVLSNQSVIPSALQKNHYQYIYPELDNALKSVI
jgi:uncharacterized protein (TIGR01777 family)